jgi:hypothetical protein
MNLYVTLYQKLIYINVHNSDKVQKHWIHKFQNLCVLLHVYFIGRTLIT